MRKDMMNMKMKERQGVNDVYESEWGKVSEVWKWVWENQYEQEWKKLSETENESEWEKVSRDKHGTGIWVWEKVNEDEYEWWIRVNRRK